MTPGAACPSRHEHYDVTCARPADGHPDHRATTRDRGQMVTLVWTTFRPWRPRHV